MVNRLPGRCQELLGQQHGVIARWQAAQAGLDLAAVDNALRRGRWQSPYRGVYAVFTGALPRTAVLWAAVLRAGPGAILSHQSAAELDSLTDEPSETVHVTVGSAREIMMGSRQGGSGLPRVAVHRSARIGTARHPSRTPPRTRIEETALDLTQTAGTLDEAMSWLTRVCSRRLTTPGRLLAAMDARPRLRWRTDLTAGLADVTAGAHSLLEWRYVHRVERPHGLPRASRQALLQVGGQRRYLDNLYDDCGVVLELDGQTAHPSEARWRDIHRDNASAATGLVTLRYSWADVAMDPCRVAAEIARVLQLRGWAGKPRACGAACSVAHMIARVSQPQ